MESKLIAALTISAGLFLTACASNSKQSATEEPTSRVSLGDVTFTNPQEDLLESLVSTPEFVPVVVGRVRSAEKVDTTSIANDDGTQSKWVSTRFVFDVDELLQGELARDKTITIVLPGGVSDGVTYAIDGLPSAESVAPGQALVLILSPVVDGLYPVSAVYPVLSDGTVVSLSGKIQLESAVDLVALIKEAVRQRQTRIAARPHDDKFAAEVDAVCRDHLRSLISAKDALLRLVADSRSEEQLATALEALDSTRTFGEALLGLTPSGETSASLRSSWASVLKAVASTDAALSSLAAKGGVSDVEESVLTIATAASELESSLQSVGAGACVGFGP